MSEAIIILVMVFQTATGQAIMQQEFADFAACRMHGTMVTELTNQNPVTVNSLKLWGCYQK